MNIDPDLLDDDLSSAMGTETLLDHASSREPASSRCTTLKGQDTWRISVTSKIQQYEMELRALYMYATSVFYSQMYPSLLPAQYFLI